MDDITPIARNIAVLCDEAMKYYDYKVKLVKKLKETDNKSSILKGKTEKEFLQQYNNYLLYMLSEIRKNSAMISKQVEIDNKQGNSKTSSNAVNPIFKTAAKGMVDKQEIGSLKAPGKVSMKISKTDIDVDSDAFSRFVKFKKKKRKDIVIIRDYSLYEQSSYGRIANIYVGRLSQKLIKNNNEFFQPLFKAMRSSDFQILANTYVSIMVFSSILVFFPAFLLSLLLMSSFIVIRIFAALLIGLISAAITFAVLYGYPSMIVTSRRKYMEADLPFVIVHMAAVAGSGAQPLAMFNLLLSSGEYKGLESEVKKIINYVNLFGYNLTTSLRLVAATTPLREFSEMLNGIVTTVETGGSLKEYLNIKAQEAMENYESKRRKYIETLATFSDLYIGLSIVAPMLLFFLLAIIDSPFLGGAIGGFSAGTIAVAGTYIVIPLMNMVFLAVLNVITPK